MGAFWLHRGGSGTVFQGSHKPESLHQDSSFEGKSIEISLQTHTFVEHVSNLTLSNYCAHRKTVAQLPDKQRRWVYVERRPLATPVIL